MCCRRTAVAGSRNLSACSASGVSGLVEGTGGVGSASNPPAIPNTGILPLPAAAFFESLPGPVQVINNLVKRARGA
jgi:hypothetical protein